MFTRGSNGFEAALRVFENGVDMRAFDAWKPRQELIDRRAALYTLEERLDGHARVLEQPGAADFSGYPLDGGALRPVDHHHKVVKFTRKSKQSDAAVPRLPQIIALLPGA